jgi:hypothetical protein
MVKRSDREIIVATYGINRAKPDYQLIVAISSGRSELYADEGQDEQAYRDCEDCSPQT